MDPVVNKNAKFYIQIAKPTVEEEEKQALIEVANRGWLSQGEKVYEFEKLISTAHGKKYGCACNSGAMALILSLNAANIGHGDEVIIPDLTMIAVVNAVLAVGATPVFADSSYTSDVGNIDKITIERCLTAKTRAIILVHTYGEAITSIQKIINFAHEKGLFVIEDCAESHYAYDNENTMVGSAGDFAIFSFYSNKIITTGEGGMVLTNCEDAKDRLDRLRMHCFTPGRHFWHTEQAWGVRMTDMQAAIGIVQHSKRHRFLARRKEIRKIYEENWKDNTTKKCNFANTQKGATNWVLPILTTNRENLRKHLAENGIDHRTYFNPFHKQEFLTKYSRGGNDSFYYYIAENFGEKGLYLPIYPTLTNDEILYICEKVNEFYA